MAKKHWEMNVTSFSSETVLASAKVEGVNWMVALGVARREIGEDGGVPAGASCTVTADGGVRVQDPVSQRTYHLRPLGAGEEPTLPSSTQAKTEPSAMEYGSTPIAGRSAKQLAREGVSNPAPTTKEAATKRASYRPSTPGASKPPPAPKPTPAEAEPPFKLQPLRARDREPTEQNPVTFRERTYVVPTGTPAPSIELLLRQEFAKIKARLGDNRSATYIAMAVFDHAWSKKPERPPVVALDWKDWRGTDPQISFPLSSPSSRPPPEPAHQPAKPKPAEAKAPAKPAEPAPRSTPPPALSAESTKKGTGSGQTRIDRPQSPAPAPAPAPAKARASEIPPPAIRAKRKGSKQQKQAVDAPIDERPTEIVEEQASPRSSSPPAPPSMAETTDADPIPVEFRSDGPVIDTSDDLPELDRDFPLEPEWTTSDASSGDLRLDIAFERSQQLFSLRSPKDGVEFVADLLEQLLPSEAFTGAIYDIDTDELRFVVVRGEGADGLQGHAIPAKAGLFGAAAQLGGGSINIAKLDANKGFVAEVDGRKGLNPQSALYLPIAAEGRLLAVIQCLNRRGAETFSDDDVEVATYLCSQLAEFLGVARRSIVPSRIP